MVFLLIEADLTPMKEFWIVQPLLGLISSQTAALASESNIWAMSS